MGEYRTLLSLYNIHVEETRGRVGRREYHGLVYSATDDKGNKVGNPFKASLFGKSVGYAAIEKRFSLSKKTDSRKEIHRAYQADGAPSTWKDLSQGQIC